MKKNGLFEALKSRVSIRQYIGDHGGLKIVRTGSTERVNPCPLCGHQDCFSIFATATWKCFSCGQAGDVVALHRRIKNISGNYESAVDLAKIYNMPVPENKQIFSDNARQLRGYAADFYHEGLLNNSSAWAYQTEKRGHGSKILKSKKIGYSSAQSDLIAYMRKRGVDPETLSHIGLCKKFRGKWRTTVPPGYFVYPHFYEKSILYFTIKKPNATKRETWQIKKKYADPAWFCLGQDAFKNNLAPVVLTEGENDYLSLLGKGLATGVIATIGNYNTRAILKEIKRIASGRKFYLCFDNDAAGRKYQERYAAAIVRAGGTTFSLSLPNKYNDIDEYLSASSHPAGAWSAMIKNAREIKINPSPPPEPPELNAITMPSSISIIGEAEGGEIVMESLQNRKIYITRIRDLTYEQLVQIGGLSFSDTVYRSEKRKRNGQIIPFLGVREKIIITAAKVQLGGIRWLGQGIHRADGSDLILINGGRAYLFRNKELVPYESPRIGRKLIQKTPGRGWIDTQKLASRLKQFDSAAANGVRSSLIKLLKEWGFAGACDAEILAGWFLAQLIQTLWPWRVHLWVTGAQSTGKSLLLELLSTLGGKLALKLEGSSQSEAGLRQAIGSSACLTIVDEAERSNKSRDAIIQLLRSGRGGLVVKGSSTQRATFFKFQHMILLASIETGLDRAAEISRFFLIEMQKDNSRRPMIPGLDDAARLRVDIFAYALWAAAKALKLICTDLRYEGVDSRLVDSFKVPAAMLALSHNDPDRWFVEYLEMFLADWDRRRRDDVQEDEIQLLDAILSSTVRVPDDIYDIGGSMRSVYVDRNISQLLQSELNNNGSGPGIHSDTLAAHGVKLCSDGLFLHCPSIERRLLRDTKWKNFNIASVLGRISEAKRTQRRLIEGTRVKGILVPRRFCFEEEAPF